MAFSKELTLKFKEAFEFTCLDLIVNAFTVVKTSQCFDLSWQENDFSVILRDQVNDSDLSRRKEIYCETEFQDSSNINSQTKGFANKLPRIDFKYIRTWKMNRYEYFMEAKRIKQHDSGLKRQYISEGMDRFISKKYPKGCMLGYLLAGSTQETIAGINSLLDKDGRSTEILDSISNKSYPSYYESSHVEIGALRHLILDFAN